MIWWMVQNFVVTAILAGCVWAVCRAGRIGPSAQHAVWLLLLVKLVTPPLVAWPWPISHESVPLKASAAAVAHVRPLRATTVAAVVPEPAHPRSSPARSFDWLSDWLVPALASVWISGSAIFVFMQGGRIRRMLQLLRTAVPADAELASLVEEAARRVRTRAVDTRVAAGIASPFIWCIHRPRLLWPAALSKDVPSEAIRGLLVHELAHLKRKDHWVGWLELAAGCLWWWNPLYWYIRHQLRESAELACDAWVVDAMDAVPQGRRTYAEALLTVCESMSSPMTAVGANTSSRRFLERRLTMILRERFPLRLSRAGVLAVALIAAGILPMWTLKAAPQTAVAQAVRPRTTAPVIPAAAQGLPNDAQELLKQFESRQAEVRRTTEATLEQQRRQLIEQLQALQDTHTKAGRLDEAVAVRDQVRRLQGIITAGDDRALVALDRKIAQVNFVNTPLKKALDDLRDMSSANLYVPWKVLNDAGATESTPVNVRVRDVPLSRALSLVLADATGGENRLTYNVEGGVIEIISRDMDARLEGFNTKLEAFTSRVEGPAVLHWDSRFPKTNIVRWGGPDSPLGLLRYQNQVGKTIRLRVSGSTDGEIWGNEIYSLDSEPGVAAVHAGLLQPGQEGTATIRILPGMARYSGLSRNGVSSLPFGAYPGSYRFEGMADVIPWVSFDPDTFSTTGGVRGYSMNGALFLFPNPEVMEKRGHLGETFEVEVTGSTEGTIWGTGVYTDDSPVATAAVHAGLLKPGERGKVRVTILPGRSSYEGSLRNGIRSDAFDSFEGSYRLEPVK